MDDITDGMNNEVIIPSDEVEIYLSENEMVSVGEFLLEKGVPSEDVTKIIEMLEHYNNTEVRSGGTINADSEEEIETNGQLLIQQPAGQHRYHGIGQHDILNEPDDDNDDDNDRRNLVINRNVEEHQMTEDRSTICRYLFFISRFSFFRY